MEKKEFTREQLDVLAELVLQEMGVLREFSHNRGPKIKEELAAEIASLHTLYNYLIA